VDDDTDDDEDDEDDEDENNDKAAHGRLPSAPFSK
jgi:hypothetical protein